MCDLTLVCGHGLFCKQGGIPYVKTLTYSDYISEIGEIIYATTICHFFHKIAS